MTRPPRPALSVLAAATAVWLMPAAPLAAQQTFELPPPSPTPTPVPAGPADERAGVIIPPRAVPEATATPEIQPLPSPSTSQPPLRLPAPVRTAPAPAPSVAATPGAAPVPAATPAPSATIAPAPLPGQSGDPLAVPSGAPLALPTMAAPEGEFTDTIAAVPNWQLIAIGGGIGALGLLGAGVLLRRRRRPEPPRHADPLAGSPAATPAASEPPRLDLTFEIIAATRSLMMFTVEYRLTIANRSARAVNDIKAVAKLSCARGGAAASAGEAQGLESIARIGPHQARSLTGSLRLPLSAITPIRQGQTALFIPLAHVTLEGPGLPAHERIFVIGTPSASGRVHPITLDQPPGGIAGLVAQAVTPPPGSAAA